MRLPSLSPSTAEASSDRQRTMWWRTFAAAVALVGLLASSERLLSLAAEHLLEHDSEQTALGYARTITDNVPGLSEMFEQRRLNPATADALRSLREIGDVFRFKLFDRDGNTLLVSDALDRTDGSDASGATRLGEHQGFPSPVVKSIVLGGRNHIELKDGRGKEGRPPLFSEAYVPLMQGGRLIGAVEVYVDQTARAERIREAFFQVACIVGVLLLIIGGALVWQWQHRQRERRLAHDRMRYLAQHDVLSGALNRASFHDALQQAAWRHESGGPSFAVLCIDLDRFKEVNDSHGHSAGDAVLREATERLRQVVRHGDVVARLGGDEFAIMQSGVTDSADVGRLAQRLVDAMAVPFKIGEHRVICTASVGAATFGSDANTIEDLLHKADVALYRAKTSGRGRFSFYDAELDRMLEDRRVLAHDLRAAIDNGSLTLHYQPLFEGADRRLIGYEALMRWSHPQRGAIAPSEFIPLAEDTGQIEVLGEWALQRACAEAATWPAPLSVSVNLSAAQFSGDSDLTRVVQSALDASGLSSRRLELEITESLLMSNTESVVNTLSKLSALGVRIAMDDFGTGYSSMAYLWRFPFDKVKIDRAFTIGLNGNRKVELIVRSIVSLAHSMGIRVNAEGVETVPQMALLQELGCDELQGFLLGRPVPAHSLRHDGAVSDMPAAATRLPQSLHGLPAPLQA
jgi:diguanylate cyclase (GGDEF)-like protein